MTDTLAISPESTPQKYVIISRHHGVVDWCARQGITGQVVPHLDINSVEPGIIYVGILPITFIENLLRKRARFWMCTSPNNLKYRISEMTADQLEEFGFSLREVCYLQTGPIRDHVKSILS